MGHFSHLTMLLIAGVLLLANTGSAQLAITEMMSKSANTSGQTIVTNEHDFWELTNFSSNTVNLAGYKFTDDKNPKRLLVTNGAPPLYIHSEESIIFVREGVFTNEAHHLIWREISLNYGGPFPDANFEYGSWFWVHTASSYLCVLAGSVLLLTGLVEARQFYRRQRLAWFGQSWLRSPRN